MTDYTREEFIKTVTRRGLASKEMVVEYAGERTRFNDADLEGVYRYQNGCYASQQSDVFRVYKGVRCTVRKN